MYVCTRIVQTRTQEPLTASAFERVSEVMLVRLARFARRQYEWVNRYQGMFFNLRLMFSFLGTVVMNVALTGNMLYFVALHTQHVCLVGITGQIALCINNLPLAISSPSKCKRDSVVVLHAVS